jgi:hypothetical protein
MLRDGDGRVEKVISVGVGVEQRLSTP